MTAALYNEIDPFACDWLEALIREGHVARGTVDRRSIRDLRPEDVAGARQFHAFAGIAGWSLALRLAGWPDDAPVWTGSCPCQPFSSAGRRRGTADERHLWPEWFRLIRECRPAIVLGEQVASPDGLAWLDAVSADLEGAGYAFGAADLCAAGVGAPHIRQRLYFVAVAEGARLPRREPGASDPDASGPGAERRGDAGAVADARGHECRPRRDRGADGDRAQQLAGRRDAGALALPPGGGFVEGLTDRRGSGSGDPAPLDGRRSADDCDAGLLGDARSSGLAGRPGERSDDGAERAAAERAGGATLRLGDAEHGRPEGGIERSAAPTTGVPAAGCGSVRGPWSDAVWIPCRDGRARPAQPGAQPLAHGVPGRVGRLRGYGNAIVPEVAATFVRAVMESIGDVEPAPADPCPACARGECRAHQGPEGERCDRFEPRPGVRDPLAAPEDCPGDGHHLCAGCRWRVGDAPATAGTETGR